MPLAVVAWVAAVASLVSYAVLASRGALRQYHVVNVCGAIPLAAYAASQGVWTSCVISLFYAGVAAHALRKDRR